MKSKRAFTLIELLVVIAIIAILAAILFPVFAQAKMAAKKAAVLSNAKQVGLAGLMYSVDNDDTFPVAGSWSPSWGWNTAFGFVDTPADWYDYTSWGVPNSEIHQAMATSWANSMQPYLKSSEVMAAPGENLQDWPGTDYTGTHPTWSNFGMNGLLTSYSASAISSPSQVPAFWQRAAGLSIRGEAWIGPSLVCADPEQPCKYQPSQPGCSDQKNGEFSVFYLDPSFVPLTRWSYNHTITYCYTDGSAKAHPYGMNLHGKTDYRFDPFSEYNEDSSSSTAWFDGNLCHGYQFRPDYVSTDKAVEG